jgi:hypothetical protein
MKVVIDGQEVEVKQIPEGVSGRTKAVSKFKGKINKTVAKKTLYKDIDRVYAKMFGDQSYDD